MLLIYIMTLTLSEKISFYSITYEPCSQKVLSLKLDGFQFQQLVEKSSPTDKSHRAASWLLVTPSIGLGFHHDPEEFLL